MAKGILAIIAACYISAFAQVSIDNDIFMQWRADRVDFTLIDIRGDENADSIIYPCFYTPDVDSILARRGCDKRLLITCHSGVAAMSKALLIVDAGYPADSVFASGYDVITSSRYPITDTLPRMYLDVDIALPQDLTAFELMAVRASARPHKVVDVRTAGEIADSGIIPGACNIEWPDTFQASLAQFDPDEDLILYCRSGNRAGQARDWILQQSGYSAEKVINFGGISKWKSVGAPVASQGLQTCRCLKPVAARYKPLSPDYSTARISRMTTRYVFDFRGRRMPDDDAFRTQPGVMRAFIRQSTDINKPGALTVQTLQH